MKKCTLIFKHKCKGIYFNEGKKFNEYFLWCYEDFKINQEESDEYFKSIDEKIYPKNFPTNLKRGYIEDEFFDTVSLDFDFARDLKLYDIIRPTCFSNTGENGEKLIEIASRYNIVFIVTQRLFDNKRDLDLSLEPCDYDLIKECMREIKSNL